MRVPALLQNKIWLGLAAGAIIGGTSIAMLLNVSKPVIVPVSVSQQTQPNVSTAIEKQLSLYWIASKDNKFVAVPMPIKAANDEAALKVALNQVITEPTTKPDLYSAIPPNTKILDFSVKGKEIHLNLSQEFTSGGGTASMTGRVVQVLYTATSLDPDANLYLSVAGKPVNYLGGEGLEISQPTNRKEFPPEF